MVDRVRTVDFLPEIFQTPTNRQVLSATLDQLFKNPDSKKPRAMWVAEWDPESMLLIVMW
jgi:hypothetical protein